MSYTLFISDLHLSSSRPDVTRALAEFLEQHQDSESLYILGDLFETWVGDDDDSELASHVRSLLAAFCASGPALFLMQGNRDFLLGADFAVATGATLLSDAVVIDLPSRLHRSQVRVGAESVVTSSPRRSGRGSGRQQRGCRQQLAS